MDWQEPRLISVEPFAPHSFEMLHKNRHILPETTHAQYQNVLDKFLAIDDVQMLRITYKSDGLNITGAMLLPPEPQVGKHPILIYNRGGSGNFGILTTSNMVLLAHYVRAGYIVFASNYRGNDGGEGQDEFGGADINDVLTLFDIAKAHPAWDGKNSYMYGHSRGGMMTYLALKNQIALNAAVAVAAPSALERAEIERPDMISIYRKYIPLFDERREAALKERAAAEWVDKFNVPLLLLHGDKDWRVDVSHTLQLDAALTEADKPHKTVIYPNGDHSLTGFRREAMEEIMRWFEAYKA